MSRQREKYLKKLQKRRILPHIALIMIISLFSLSLLFAIGAFLFENGIGNKMIDAYDSAHEVTNVYKVVSYAGNYDQAMRSVVGYNTVVTDVYIEDNKTGEKIESFGTHKPDKSKMTFISFMGEEYEIIPGDNPILVFNEEGGLSIDYVEMLKARNPIKLLSIVSAENAGREWIGTTCWIVLRDAYKNFTMYVNCKIGISQYEAVCLIGALFCAATVIVIFSIYQFIVILRILGEQRRTFKALNTDFVTGGHNRIYFANTGHKYLKRRNGRKYAVANLRLEKYKNFCMYYGVNQGAELLENIYQLLNKQLKKREIVAHIDEANFSLLLTVETPEQLNARLNDILKQIEALRPGQKMYISVGIVQCDGDSNTDRFYTEAGIARSSVKTEDENRIVWFNDSMKGNEIWERKVEEDMESALQSHQFQVYLQPKYSTRGETLAAAEALVRWIHPTEGFISPGRFIPIFEKNGFIMKLDDYMISETARVQAEWLSKGRKLVPISVNVSRIHFTREDLAEHIGKLVDEYHVPHEYIELELTESAFFDDKKTLLKTVRKLQEMGFKISMDDFGAGYSSLNSLKELPLDIIKLDAEFFRGTDDFDRAETIVTSTIELAKTLGMSIVAEGIETREQVDFLAQRDCDLIQGFYFAKPMPIAEFEQKAYPNEADL